MGIMPADRDAKWQRIFRRFSLPGDPPQKDAAPGEQDQPDRRGPNTVEKDKQTGRQPKR